MADRVEPARSGRLVPHGKAADFADGLAAMLSDPDQVAQMGQAARHLIFSEFGEEQFNETAGTIVARLDALVRARRSATGGRNARSA